MEYPDIDKLLPHDWPMIVIDRVIDSGEDWLETEVRVSPQHVLFDSSQNALPAWAIIEIMAQSIAAYAGLDAVSSDRPVVLGFLLGTRKLEFSADWIPAGTVVRTRVSSQFAASEGLGAFDCESRVDGKAFSSGVINVYQAAQEKREG